MRARGPARAIALVVALASGFSVAWLLSGPAAASPTMPPPTTTAAAPPPPPFGRTPSLPRCTISGTARPDVLRGTRRADVLCGADGRDRIAAGGSDTVIAGRGDDTILARNDRADVVFGGPGVDRVSLDAGIDLAYGVEKRLGVAGSRTRTSTTVAATAVRGALGTASPTWRASTRAVPPGMPASPFESGLARLTTIAPAPPGREGAPALRIGRTGWYRHTLVGKIYFNVASDGPGVVHFCTGTVVDANVVITAAHCIYDLQDGFATNWTFAPRKWDRSEPLGRWEAREATVPTEWVEATKAGSADYAHDYGFLILRPNAAGRSVGDVTGTAAILTNSISSWLWSIGYPTGSWFGQWGSKGEGGYPHYCYSPYGSFYGPVTDTRGSAGYEIGIGCTMTSGSSGGPWFAYANGHWANVVSVNSHCYPFPRCNRSDDQAMSQNMWGPWFTDRVITDFEDARRR